MKLHFEYHYCQAVFPDFMELLKHFLKRHAHQEHIVIETESFSNDNGNCCLRRGYELGWTEKGGKKMAYEDVKAKCFFCEATIEGNQRFMMGGGNLPLKRGRCPNWLKAKPEHKWAWNGLSDYIDGEKKSYDFYLCPLHQERRHYQQAFDWAQKQIDNLKGNK